MKKLFTRQIPAITLTLFLFLFGAFVSRAFAQTADEAMQAETGQGQRDANWATALGLTPDQIARIRTIRQQNRAERQMARQRLNQAQRALDEAIYSDDANEDVIEQRAREVAEAQAADVRLRAMTELSIRRVLTPQQLNTFRTIRLRRIREAQIRRRLENANPQRALRNRRLENGLDSPPMRDRFERRPAGGGQGGRVLNPLPGARRRQGQLLRRIRP
jgi:Spy/CpxP family protein refolding chaperone